MISYQVTKRPQEDPLLLSQSMFAYLFQFYGAEHMDNNNNNKNTYLWRHLILETIPWMPVR